MTRYLKESGGNPGRSGHRLSVAAGRAIYDAREQVASLFGSEDPLRVVFAPNVTYAVNLVLKGLLRPGDHVVTTSMEHNSVMRPLRALESEGVKLTVVGCEPDGSLDAQKLSNSLTSAVRLVVLTHGSNVTGTVMPVAEVAATAHRAGALVLLDAAQTAGSVPVELDELGIDILAFTGHKSLLGPPGTGGLVFAAGMDYSLIAPLVRGGTGSRSEHETQPDFLPDRFESGTANGPGLAGLAAGIRHVHSIGTANIHRREAQLTQKLVEGLRNIPGVVLYGPLDRASTLPVVSCQLIDRDCGMVAAELDSKYGIMCRVGLHCAPSAHRTIGTFPTGTIRLSPGFSTTEEEINYTIDALRRIAVGAI